MKKLIGLFLLAAMMLSLVSCGGNSGSGAKVADIDKIKKEGVIRIGMECDYAPFNWMVTNPTETSEKIQSGGYADGYDVYFSRLVADALGVEVEVVKLQ